MSKDFYDGKRVLVTGGHGFLGTHLVRKLRERAAFVVAPTKDRLDLTNAADVHRLMGQNVAGGTGIDLIFHLAAHVGGIHYNLLHPAWLIEDNCLMAFGVCRLANAFKAKLVAAGSVCAYPKNVPVPTTEENLYEGYPEESNGAYGNAKRILLEAQKAAWSQYALQSVHLVSANLYGPGDHFDPRYSHVIPALIVKVQECIDTDAFHLEVWGTGRASRDFLYVEDAADAYLAAGEFVDCPPQPINISTNQGIPIAAIAKKLCEIMGYDGSIVYDTTKPDGQPRRNFKNHKIRHLTDWEPTTSLDAGLEKTVEWYRKNVYGK